MLCFEILRIFGENRKKKKKKKTGKSVIFEFLRSRFYGFLRRSVGNPHRGVALRRSVGCPRRNEVLAPLGYAAA